MANLTGQAIQNTYPGLLNLATATTGITSTPQQIQDGLGNNTNTRISTTGIISPNIIGMNNLKPDYAGSGFQTGSAGVNIANSQNKTLYTLFYDPGVHSYSAISYNIGTLSTTTDVVTMAFYSMQQVPNIGVAPQTLIMSGITLESYSPSTTGLKTVTLPSTLSFSGTGGGYYIVAFNVSNSGVTPTIRYGSPVLAVLNQSYAYNIGFYLNSAGTGLAVGQKYGSTSFANVLNLPLQASYTASDITTNYTTTIVTQPLWGFGLKTI